MTHYLSNIMFHFHRQFLLEILTDREHCDKIESVGGEGEFRLLKPDEVATLWGQRKNKPNMNYEKMSRALRQATIQVDEFFSMIVFTLD